MILSLVLVGQKTKNGYEYDSAVDRDIRIGSPIKHANVESKHCYSDWCG